jgi:hypothetical protein
VRLFLCRRHFPAQAPAAFNLPLQHVLPAGDRGFATVTIALPERAAPGVTVVVLNGKQSPESPTGQILSVPQANQFAAQASAAPNLSLFQIAAGYFLLIPALANAKPPRPMRAGLNG